MKKVIVIILFMFLLTGCTNVSKLSYDQILGNISTRSNRDNTYRTGYSYYLPRNMRVRSSTLYNEVITDSKYKYYLYVDLVSYSKGVVKDYKVNNNAVYSKSINYDGKFGYAEINLLKNDKYLVEIMYNYAKIEVIVEKEDINKSVTNAMIVLSTITYTDDIVKNLLSIDEVTSSEEKFSVFDEDASDSNFLEVYKEYGNYEGDDKVPDLDVIK